jgi:ATP-dependent Clp protease ATP-binding subunit ClpC
MNEMYWRILLGVVVALIFVGTYWFQKKRGIGGRAKKTAKSGEFTTNFNELAKQGKIDKVSGRDEEIERVIHILMRRTKSNPLLLGEPGVGKTAVVELLARRIVKGEVPAALKGKQVWSLDLNALLSGTQYRGELEKRLQGFISQMEGMSREVIIFIDELHLLEQTGKAEGSMQISDVLKPALSRGDLQVVGATTWKEYQEYIKQDEPLDRRFMPVFVDEPNVKQTLAMLKTIRGDYEKFHKVKITDKALEAAVKLSDEKISTRYLPDKAIDLMDEAAAKVSIDCSVEHKVPLGVVHAASKKSKKEVTSADIKEVVAQWVINNKEEAKRDARKNK